jgi:hypothetical protein
MAAGRTAFVTGDKALDRVLRTFPEMELKKAVRKATRATVKNVTLPAYKANVVEDDLVESGAMRDAGKVKAVARSREQYGHELNIDFDQVVAKREAAGARVGRNKKNELFRYTWAYEFGEQNLPGVEPPLPKAPIRKALEKSKDAAKLFFNRALRVALVQVAARAKLTIPRFRD